MEIRHLKYFIAVAEHGTFTRAAAQSFVAQSALSEQIARLEREVGATLFHRTSRTVTLTPAGTTLLPLARGILADVDHAESEMAALTGLRAGRLRLGIVQSSSGTVDLIDLVRRYRGAHPAIELTVISGASRDMAAAVSRGELDLAIVGLKPSDLPSALHHRSLGDDPLVAVLSHDAAASAPDPLELAALLELGPFIHFLPGSGIRTGVVAAFERSGLAVSGAFEIGTISDMIRLAAAGLGVTIVPATSADLQSSTAQFAVRTLADPAAVHPLGVVHDPRRLSPATAAFLASLPQSAVSWSSSSST